MHVLCALVLFGIVRRTLLKRALREQFGNMADRLAAACALIWLVHPLQTEPVNYVTQRTESIMGLFYLLTLYTAIRGLYSERDAWWHTASVLSCSLGMASKEVMVTAPLIVVLYDAAFRSGSFREIFDRRWPLYAGLAATWGILAAVTWSGPRSRTVGFSANASALDYAMNQCVMLTRYLYLAVWPSSLVFDYGTPQPAAIMHVPPYAVIVAALMAAAAIALVHRRPIGFLGAWFFLLLAPTSSVHSDFDRSRRGTSNVSPHGRCGRLARRGLPQIRFPTTTPIDDGRSNVTVPVAGLPQTTVSGDKTRLASFGISGNRGAECIT